MKSWRDPILKEFTPRIARLTVAADPDGLLLEEGVLKQLAERGFELMPFEDHVAFRYAYESRHRSRWDRGEPADLVVVLRAAAIGPARTAARSPAGRPAGLVHSGRAVPEPELSGHSLTGAERPRPLVRSPDTGAAGPSAR